MLGAVVSERAGVGSVFGVVDPGRGGVGSAPGALVWGCTYGGPVPGVTALGCGDADNGNYWIPGADSPVGAILTELGVRFASATASVAEGATKSVSYERADLLKDADYVVYCTNNDGSPANNIQKLFALQAFKDLPVTKSLHLVGTSDFLPGSYSDAIGVIDSLEKAPHTWSLVGR